MDYFYYIYNHNHIQFSSHIYKVSSYHYNWHDDVEILILLKGHLEMSCNAEVFKMNPFDVVIISPQIGHATLALEPDTMAIVMHIDKEYFTAFDSQFDGYHFVLHSDSENRDTPFYEHVRHHVAAMMLHQYDIAWETMGRKHNESNISPSLFMEQQFSILAYDVYEEVLHHKTDSILVRSKDTSSTTFVDMISYIDDNYHGKIELEDIANIGGYSVAYTSQFFKRHMGISFMEYLLRLRLREATVRLANSDEPISRIANSVGFADIKAFNVAFKKQFHTTPSHYRSIAKEVGRETKLHDWKELISAQSDDVLAILKDLNTENETETKEDRLKIVQSELEKLLEILK
ncbi:AraC family transcriptional regulator [Veillonella agrestimuris]|uniref:AraC family transcriptional regulator n=1 Tax=Veillonella agrestimuris TaxID=2941340 RepID=UPI00203D23D7|nr:AraC family transcriptional regulator [Veillonella agrestimuris]